MLADLPNTRRATFIGSLMYTLSCFPRLKVDFTCFSRPTVRGRVNVYQLTCCLLLPSDGPTYTELVSDIEKLVKYYGYALHPSFIPCPDGYAVTLQIIF